MFGSSGTSPKGLCLAVLQSRKAVVILQIRLALRQLCLSGRLSVGSRALCPLASLSLCHLGFEGIDARAHAAPGVMQITQLAGRTIGPVAWPVGSLRVRPDTTSAVFATGTGR
ncbi:hypothetical protein [Streptacidiphilus anmyonensis]|uniref:hypothetical protein n=1 Tax=Streptacidiphilus anmyonensis TaxID=405782 RepID=UPI0005A6061A|nr:hypothetical protein [Streptacidiphilus anmyonensis]